MSMRRPAGEFPRLVCELLDAHDDTTRLGAESLELDCRWWSHLDYLARLQRLAREQLAHDTDDRVGALDDR
jgi:hypothetical protein